MLLLTLCKHKSCGSVDGFETAVSVVEGQCAVIVHLEIIFGVKILGHKVLHALGDVRRFHPESEGEVCYDLKGGVVVDGDNVWFGATDRGVRRYITTVSTWFKYTTTQGLVSDHITFMGLDGRDIWMGTAEHGLGRYDKVENTWQWYSKRDMLASNQIQALFARVSGQGDELWVGTIKGLSHYNTAQDVWTNYTKADGLTTNYITDVAHDPVSETLWIGTPLGLGQREGERWYFYTEPSGLANDFVTGVSTSGEGIWAATKTAAKNRYVEWIRFIAGSFSFLF